MIPPTILTTGLFRGPAPPQGSTLGWMIAPFQALSQAWAAHPGTRRSPMLATPVGAGHTQRGSSPGRAAVHPAQGIALGRRPAPPSSQPGRAGGPAHDPHNRAPAGRRRCDDLVTRKVGPVRPQGSTLGWRIAPFQGSRRQQHPFVHAEALDSRHAWLAPDGHQALWAICCLSP